MAIPLMFMFAQFLNNFLSFPMVISHISPSVFKISSGVSTVSPQCFSRFLFQILCNRFPLAVLLKYILIRFIAENDRSLVAVIAGKTISGFVSLVTSANNIF